jgi:hypothetical protein
VSSAKAGARNPSRGLGEDDSGAPIADGTREKKVHRIPAARIRSIPMFQRFPPDL